MDWKVEFDKEASNELQRLDPSAQKKILRYLRTRITTEDDPQRFGEPLRSSLAGFWKYRIGDYRLICRIEKNKVVVLVLRVGHRKNVYKKGSKE